MPRLCVADLETFYDKEFSLSKIGTDEYVRSPLFETIGGAFKWDDEPTVWVPQPEFDAYVQSQDWSDVVVVAQNTAFDGAVLRWRYGVKPLAWWDIMGMSRALFPEEKSHSLKAQAERMGVGVKGDEVVNALGKRYKDFTEEQLARYAQYCINDVELTRKLLDLYLGMGFPKKELSLIDITLRMFINPRFRLNKDKLEAHYQKVLDRKQELLGKIADMYLDQPQVEPELLDRMVKGGMSSLDAIKPLLMSNEKFANMLRSLGVEPPMKVSPTTGKETYAFAKTDEEFIQLQEHPDPMVQALVEARLGNKSTLEETRTLKFAKMADMGPFSIPLRYYGARTGRWSGEGGVNLQNLPARGDTSIKACVEAPKGHVICGADLSNIELRLGLWLAGQDDAVQALASGQDLYKLFAAEVYCIGYDDVNKEQRQVGKVSNLSLIYGTGPARLREALRIMGGVTLELDEVKPIVRMYRDRYTRVVDAWGQGDVALSAIINDQSASILRPECGLVVEGKRGIRLPSGLWLQYPELRRETDEKGKAQWKFTSKGQPTHVYGAKVFQGLTQSVARCIMADGIRKLNKRYPVRLTVHDSVYWVVKEAEAEEALKFGIECITAPVPYCPGLPLAAEGAFGPTLADC